MSLHVLAYNLKRVMKLLGVGGFIDAIRTCALYWFSNRGNFSRLATVPVLRAHLKKAICGLGFDGSPAQYV